VLQAILTAFPWPTVTPVGLCVGFTWLIVTGKLLPRSTADRLAADQAKRIESMESALSDQRATITSLVEQNAELSVSGKLSVALLQSLQSSSNHAGPAGASTFGTGHVAPSIED
jgi:hypothetical protein